jgi:hypothetical protein
LVFVCWYDEHHVTRGFHSTDYEDTVLWDVASLFRQISSDVSEERPAFVLVVKMETKKSSETLGNYLKIAQRHRLTLEFCTNMTA